MINERVNRLLVLFARQKNGISNQETIPTALVKSTCVAGGTFCDLSDYASIIAANGSPYIYDPSTGALDGTGRSVFCGPLGDVAATNCVGSTNGTPN